MNIDLKVIEAIMVSGIGGFGVKYVTDWLKGLLKVKGFLAYVVSLVVCAGAVALYLIPIGWAWELFAAYTGFVFASANGFYRAIPRKAK